MPGMNETHEKPQPLQFGLGSLFCLTAGAALAIWAIAESFFARRIVVSAGILLAPFLIPALAIPRPRWYVAATIIALLLLVCLAAGLEPYKFRFIVGPDA